MQSHEKLSVKVACNRKAPHCPEYSSIAGARGASALGVVWLIWFCGSDAALRRLQQDLLEPVGKDDGRKVRQNGVGARLREPTIGMSRRRAST